MKIKAKTTRKTLGWLLVLMLLWTSTALAQETFTNGYFTYQIPEGMKPDSELTRKVQWFAWEDESSLVCVQSVPTDNEKEWTLDKLQMNTREKLGDLTLIEEIHIEAEDVESWAGVTKMEMAPNMWVDYYVLAAQKEEQLLMVDFVLFNGKIEEEKHDEFFFNWVDTIVVNETPEWSELVLSNGQQDRYENGRYFLSDADAYVEVNDQINEVFVRNPPSDKETLAKQNGYTAERMREVLSSNDADMIIYPQQYPEMRIIISMVSDQYHEDLTYTQDIITQLVNTQDALALDLKAYHSEHVSYLYGDMGAKEGLQVRLYQSVVNGNDVFIRTASEIPLTDAMIAYVENIIDHISFGQP